METVWLIVVMVLAATTIYFGGHSLQLRDEVNAHDATREHRNALLEELSETKEQLNDLSLKYDDMAGMLGRIQDVLDEDEDEPEWE